jgi:uncharacterized protein DUF3606
MRREPNDKHYMIDPRKPWHLAWWANELGVSEDALTEAINRVGVAAEAVADFLAPRSAGVRQWRRRHH